MNCLLKRRGSSDLNHTILPQRAFIGARPKEIHSTMANRRNSSSRSSNPKPGDWERCSIPHSELVALQTKGLLPPAYMVPVRAGIATYNGGEQAESVPNPDKGERVCLVPYLIRGLGFPIHPFLRGLLEFYGLQLHNLTPASVLHIAGFVALCELFLGVEAHFELWKELFCLVPRSKKGSMYQVGEAKVWRIAGTGYLSGTPKKASEDWPLEWFFIEDVRYRILSGSAPQNSIVLP